MRPERTVVSGGDTSHPAERRLRWRVELGSQLLVRLGDAVWHADCVDVSMGGALLAVLPREPLDPRPLLGRSGELVLEHRSGGEHLAVEAAFTVVRVEAAAPYPEPFLLGVRFTELRTESSIQLFQVIRWQSGDPEGGPAAP